MKFAIKNNSRLQGFIGSLILQATLAIFPSEAATFSHLSNTYIELSNFNQSPYEVGADGQGRSTTITDEGLLSSNLDIDANFFVEPSIFAYSQSQASLGGTATNYLGNLQFSSILMGKFFILKDQSLKFDLKGSLELFNSTDDLLFSNLSTFGRINLFLRDSVTQKYVNIFNIFSAFNTNLIYPETQNNFLFTTSQNIQINNYNKWIYLGENQETIQTMFTGSFEKKFTQDTQIDLVIVTQSCYYASNIVDVCNIEPNPLNDFSYAVPESSDNSISVIFIIGLGCWFKLFRNQN